MLYRGVLSVETPHGFECFGSRFLELNDFEVPVCVLHLYKQLIRSFHIKLDLRGFAHLEILVRELQNAILLIEPNSHLSCLHRENFRLVIQTNKLSIHTFILSRFRRQAKVR